MYRSYTVSAVQSGRRDYSAGILNNAVFSQLEFTPTKDVRIVAGGRYDGISYDFKNNLTPGANYGAADEVRRFGRFSPKVGATLAVNERNSLYTNLSGGFKPPEVSELYGKSAIPDLRASTMSTRKWAGVQPWVVASSWTRRCTSWMAATPL